MLCETLVLSPLNFCDTVYGPCLDSYDTKRVQKLQNSCLRLIFGIRRRDRVSHKLKEIGWLNMYNQRVLHAVCFFYKIIKYKTPPYLYKKIKHRTDVHNLNVRRKNLLSIPAHNKEFFKRSFSYRIAHYVNKYNINDYLVSEAIFKKKFKTSLFDQQ